MIEQDNTMRFMGQASFVRGVIQELNKSRFTTFLVFFLAHEAINNSLVVIGFILSAWIYKEFQRHEASKTAGAGRKDYLEIGDLKQTISEHHRCCAQTNTT
jgi:hypothetical protein